MIRAQGGNPEATRTVAREHMIVAEDSGYISRIDAEQLGRAVIDLGGGRRIMSDRIDHSVGMEMMVRTGDQVERGRPLVRLFVSSDNEPVVSAIRAAIVVSDSPVEAPPVIREHIGDDDITDDS